jgi:hypothetical protein
LDGQVNQHSGDLGGQVFTGLFLNVLVDEFSDLGLVVWVVGDHGIHEHGSLLVVFSNGGVHVHGGESAWAWSLSELLLLLLGHVVHSGETVLIGHGSGRLLLEHLARSLVHGGSAAHLVVVVLRSAALLVLHVASVDAVLSVAHVGDEGLDQLEHLWLVDDVDVEVGGALLLVVLEVGLVLGVFLLDLSQFLDLIKVDMEGSVLDGQDVVDLVLGEVSGVGRLEAHEGVDDSISVFAALELDALDFSELAEDGLELLLGGGGGEVLDVEVASLLGVLVPEHFFLLFLFSLVLLEGGLHVEDLSVEGLAVEVGHSFVGCIHSVVFVVFLSLRGSVANKGILGFLFASHLRPEDGAGDVSVLGEDGGELGLIPGGGNVLDVDVVEDSSQLPSLLGVVGEHHALRLHRA